MNKPQKILTLSLMLILSSLLAVLALMYVDKVSFPPQLASWTSRLYPNSGLQLVLAPYIFWLALGLLGLLLIAALVIIFYPRQYTEVALEEAEAGRLGIKKSALEAYVRTLVQEEGLMPSPTVKAKLFRHRFKIYVSGKIIPRVAVPEKVAILERQISLGLDQFFGIKKKLDYQVLVTHLEPETKARSGRVE